MTATSHISSALTSVFNLGNAREFTGDVNLGDPGVKPLVNLTITSISVIVLAFIGWAAVSRVQETAITFGEAVPVGSIQSIQHLEGGIVSEILVKEGQMVDAGQPLLRFNSASAQSDRGQLQSRKLALQVQAERLRAFAENRPADFTPYAAYPELVQEQNQILAAQIQARDDQRKVLLSETAEQKSRLTSLKQEKRVVNDSASLIHEKVDMRKSMYEKGLNSKLNMLEAQRELAAVNSELQQLSGSINTTEDAIRALEARSTELDGRLRQEALEKLGAVSAELAEVGTQMSGMNDRVERLVAISPVRGIVQSLPVKTLGGVIAPGGVVAQIVPIGDGLLVETRISTKDIGFVAPGQPVKVKVHAYDYARYGSIDGTLESVSPTTFLDDKNMPYYQGRVLLKTDHVGNDATTRLVTPGMTVQADINTGEKTILQYLLKPIYTTVEGSFHER